MTQTLYQLTFNDNFSTREQITASLNARSDVFTDWYYCFINTIFVVTTLSPTQFREFLQSLTKNPEARFFISEIKRYPLNEGWLPNEAWDFINKYSKF